MSFSDDPLNIYFFRFNYFKFIAYLVMIEICLIGDGGFFCKFSNIKLLHRHH
jgi:hypothetical protein